MQNMFQQIMDIDQNNEVLRHKSPEEIIQWALSIATSPIITTNFGPYSASLLHAVVNQHPDIDVVWIDTGYNTSTTYKYALQLIELLQLNLHTYLPKQTAAFRDAQMGIPRFDDPLHEVFTEQVKLEPFKRAIDFHKPDLWFSNLRRGKSAFRDSIDILSYSKEGILKVSPFYYYTDEDIENYLATHQLPNEKRYYDPTKQLVNRECGLHC